MTQSEKSANKLTQRELSLILLSLEFSINAYKHKDDIFFNSLVDELEKLKGELSRCQSVDIIKDLPEWLQKGADNNV